MSHKEKKEKIAAEQPWMRIQQSTFRNWINVKLQDSGEQVVDLVADLQSGINLCALAQSLTGQKIPRIFTGDKLNEYQQMFNLNLAIECFKRDGVVLINIGECCLWNARPNGALLFTNISARSP